MRLGLDNKLIRSINIRAKQNPKRVVFAEADNYKILKAAQSVLEEGIATPILLGDVNKIKELIKENDLDLANVLIIDPKSNEQQSFRKQFGEIFFQKRKRKGVTLFDAEKLMRDRNHFGAMMVENGNADAMISGLTRNYSETIRPALQIIGIQSGVNKVAGMYILFTKKGPFFFADTTMNINPTTEDLIDIAVLTAEAVKRFNIAPRIALLSYSNFGSSEGEVPKKVSNAVDKLHKNYPGMIVDGEIQVSFALNNTLLKEQFSFSDLVDKNVNTLIFPDLTSGNIAYQLMKQMGGIEAIGPILLGLKKPVHVLQQGSSVREIINMVSIAVLDAQSNN
jgi:malate dehydrogenase (oxaloacetate-decarboxylating)(NADP+)